MWVVVPVKPFALAKRRLGAVLADAERADLARIMLHDLLTVLAQSRRVSGVLLVSREPGVVAFAERFGAAQLQEAVPGLSNAVDQGAAHLAARGETAMLMIPSDVPLATTAEIDALIAEHFGAPCVSIVSDLEGVGTNAIAVSPPDLMPFRFGKQSYFVHRAAAEALGARVRTPRVSGLALDIDTPEDLRRLLTYEMETETLAFLCDHNVASRIMPRHNVLTANAGQQETW